MEHNNELKQHIMRRVYIVYTVRRLLSGTALRLYALLALALGLFSSVSVVDVLINMPKEGLTPLYEFAVAAVTHTEFVVQLMLMAACIVGVWIVRDMARTGAHVNRGRMA